MTGIYSLEYGIEESVRKIKTIEEKPVLVAVYGNPLSGAANFVNELRDKFKAKNQFDSRSMRALSCWNRHDELLSIIPTLRKVNMKFTYILHCPWERGQENENQTDPYVIAKEFAKMDIHLGIGVYNQNYSSHIKGNYDLVIANHHKIH